MRRLYPHAFINMWLRYGWAPWPYRVKCWLVLKFSDKTRKTSCISGSIRYHRLVNQTGSGFNSLSSLIQLFSDPLTAQLRVTHSLSHHLLSATECDAVRRRAPHSVEHVLSYLQLTRADTQPLEYFVNCRQSDKRRCVCARVVRLYVRVLFFYCFTVQEDKVPVSIRQLLEMFCDGDLKEDDGRKHF